MKKYNQWVHGKDEFVAPPLAGKLIGQAGCFFQEGVFDPHVGMEVFLNILEEHEFSKVLASLKSVKLFCKTGMARTSHGQVAFLVFSIYNALEYISAYELYLNPQKIETIRLLSSLGQQTHLKVIIYDSEEGLLRNLYEFENVFGFDDFVCLIAQAIGHEPGGNFAKAKEEFIGKYTLEELLES